MCVLRQHLRLPERLKRFASSRSKAWYVVAGVCIALPILLHLEITDPERYGTAWDFPGYYFSAVSAFEDPRAPLYAPFTSSAEAISGTVFHRNVETLRYNAPPQVALLMAPLSKLSLPNGYYVILALNYACLAGSCYLLNRRYWPFLLSLVLFSYPVVCLQKGGNFGGIILLLWVLGSKLEEKERLPTSAFCFSLATVLKVFPAVVVVLFLFKRRWRLLAWYAGLLSAMFTVGIAIQGASNYLLFWDNFRAISAGPVGWHAWSLPNAFARAWIGSAAAEPEFVELPLWLQLIIKAISIGLLLLVVYKRRDSESLAAVTLAVAPFSWNHYYTLTLFPLVRKWQVTPAFLAATLLMQTSVTRSIYSEESIVLAVASIAAPALAAVFVALTPTPRYGSLAWGLANRISERN